MKRNIFQILLHILGVGFLTSTLVFSQETPSSKMKNVRVYVQDYYGKPFSNLKPQNFVVKEDGEEQKIEYFEEEREPFAVAVLIDINYFPSLSSYLALKFIQKFDSKNRYSIIGFNKGIEDLALWDSDDGQLINALSKISDYKEENSSSVFNDAMIDGFEKLKSSSLKKKIILVFANGYDVKSKTNLNKLTETAKKSDVTIIGIAFNDDSFNSTMAGSQHETLDKLTAKTGGRVFDFTYPASGPTFQIDVFRDSAGRTIRREIRDAPNFPRQKTNLEQQYEQYVEVIANMIGKTYLIGYFPRKADGKRRECEVKLLLDGTDSKKLKYDLRKKEMYLEN